MHSGAEKFNRMVSGLNNRFPFVETDEMRNPVVSWESLLEALHRNVKSGIGGEVCAFFRIRIEIVKLLATIVVLDETPSIISEGMIPWANAGGYNPT